ncbi:hypothetical protein C8Q78DRAFT_192145 [Trametes maxima]|nr:hypothetical protein C8Q78DRAFT_192145 [Trametes maxima]
MVDYLMWFTRTARCAVVLCTLLWISTYGYLYCSLQAFLRTSGGTKVRKMLVALVRFTASVSRMLTRYQGSPEGSVRRALTDYQWVLIGSSYVVFPLLPRVMLIFFQEYYIDILEEYNTLGRANVSFVQTFKAHISTSIGGRLDGL